MKDNNKTDTTLALAVEPIANKDLTKEELVTKVEDMEKSCNLLFASLQEANESVNKMATELNQANKIQAYYERKFKILTDILTLEKGE